MGLIEDITSAAVDVVLESTLIIVEPREVDELKEIPEVYY